MLILHLLACGLPHRVVKSLLAPDYVTAAAGQGELATVTYQSGEKGEPSLPYEPTVIEVDGRSYREAVEVSSSGWIDVAPLAEGVDISLWVRNPGLTKRDFTQVRSVTGELERRFSNEIRFLPEHLTEPVHLQLRQLTNVYNDYELGEGDLLLVEASKDGVESERYLFRTHEFGPRFKYGGGLLFTIPLAFAGENQPETTSAVLAFTTSFGYRFHTRSPVLRWFGGKSAVMISTGVGSTALTSPDFSQAFEDQLLGHFSATIAGGGFEFYDFISVQALANVTALSRDLEEAPWVLAIGFDPVQFALFTRARWV